MGWSDSMLGRSRSKISNKMLTPQQHEQEKDNHARKQESLDNSAKIKKLEDQLKAQKNAAPAPQPKAAPPKPKPKGDQQIDPPKASPEISAAQKVVNSYQDGLKDKKSPWEQASANADSSGDTGQFGNFNPGGNSTPSNQPQSDPQQFADKYKLDLMNSGATNNSQAGNESSMSGADILKRDKQQGWS